jgi:hypothetical protein
MFGGDVISLILPKLILSVTRDGILTFSRPHPEHHFLMAGSDFLHCLTTINKQAAFNGMLACANVQYLTVFNLFVTLK